jgi:hypothetical protein
VNAAPCGAPPPQTALPLAEPTRVVVGREACVGDLERTFAWLGHFRRLAVRYEWLITTYAGFFHLACALLTLRRVLK